MRYTMIINVQKNRSLSEFSTFGIGGPISHFIEVKTGAEMADAFAFAKEQSLPCLILGKGSNCLFPDEGFSGLAILNKIDFIEWGEGTLRVGSGYNFSLLGVQTARKNWAGLEFASGIPATVGGAIFMNAGANGGSTSDCLETVTFLDVDGQKHLFQRSELSFSYRHSPFQQMRGAILEASFRLKPEPTARAKQLQIIDYRLKTQPYNDKSAGCVFRNPETGLSAGALIERCGLKGLTIGGAKISEMHANFIINTERATAQDVKALIAEIQARVQKQTGVRLELEVRIL
ncbi:MAG: UDP-N-acetylmuramate dehydrogenase [Chlamydiia bacterium]|nr:UDP-N-acetylmuramate dehydrogenase [Chlamydiia bacterium]